MEISKELTNNIENSNNVEVQEQQKSFLQSNTWNVINKGLDIAIKALLPNFIDDQVIEVKDAIIENGFKSGVKQAVDSAVDIGKSAMGIVTGKFETVSQAHEAVKKGGIIDSVSSVLSQSVNKAVEKNKIPKSTGRTLIQGKNAILNSIETNIENNYTYQLNSIEKLDKYTKNWQECYKNQDFKGMEKEYKKIEKILPTVLPIENTLKNVRNLENIHLLVKNTGENFALTDEQLGLAKELAAVS